MGDMGGLDSRYWRIHTQRPERKRAMGSEVMWTGRSWIEGGIRGIKRVQCAQHAGRRSHSHDASLLSMSMTGC